MPAHGSSIKKRLRKLAAEIPDDRFVQEVLQRLAPDDNLYADHAIAIIGASIVDKALEVALVTHFRESLSLKDRRSIFDFDYNGPLADLSARIKLADALDIVGSKTLSDLKLIQQIRNAFAHAPQLIGFSHPDVESACSQLHTRDAESEPAKPRKPRKAYIDATTAISARLKHQITLGPNDVVLRPRQTKLPIRIRD